MARLLQKLKRPPWRTFLLLIGLLLLIPAGYALWQPGVQLEDGCHDRGRNGIWLAHGWLGADDWFRSHFKTGEIGKYRQPERIRELATRLRDHHITDVFPHLCPTQIDGQLPPVDDPQVEKFLDHFSGFRVMPWIGGPNDIQTDYPDSRWRDIFINSVRSLLQNHPRLAGVHLNIEPLTSGDPEYLILLQQLHEALPEGKILSLAAYPPPTRWQPSPEVHWDQNYYEKLARHCDQIVPMMYDTSIRFPKFYQKLMADWTTQVLQWSGKCEVLLGLPAYHDAGVGYHDPGTENLPNALPGIHRGLSQTPIPAHYQGVALYCDWEMDEGKWATFRKQFLKP